MTTIGICDDEAFMREELERCIAAYMDKTKLAYRCRHFATAAELLGCGRPPDIVFLDIQMEGVDGMEAARRLRAAGGESFLVFVTVSPARVFDAFQVEATDYLVKPVDARRVAEVLARILRRMEERRESFLPVRQGAWLRYVRYGELYYVEALRRKLHLHTADGAVEYYGKLEALAKTLPPSFFRCHRSYLVNLAFVREADAVSLRLSNGAAVPLSRLRQQEFAAAMLVYIRGGGAGDG